MKVAIFTDIYLPVISGLSTSVQDISRLLAEKGHQVLIVAPKPQQPIDLGVFNLHPEIEVFWAPSIDLRLYPEIRVGLPNMRMIRRLREFKPDVIHTQAPFLVGFQGLVLGKQFKIPLITTYHANLTDQEGLKILHLDNSRVAVQLQKGAGKVVLFFLNRHDRIIVPTQDTLDDVRQLGVKLPTTIIPSPVDNQRLKAARSRGLKLRESLGIKQAMIYVGRLSGEKNIDLVIKSFALAKKELPQLKLVLIGDGPERKRLSKLAAKLEIATSIVWVGQVNHDRLINEGYLYLGDVFVTLSRLETQGISTIEAMACGLPVIGANARATKELVKGVGKLVETDDLTQVAKTLVQLLTDESEYKKLSQRSLKKAEHFSPQVVGTKIIQEYQKLINSVPK